MRRILWRGRPAGGFMFVSRRKIAGETPAPRKAGIASITSPGDANLAIATPGKKFQLIFGRVVPAAGEGGVIFVLHFNFDFAVASVMGLVGGRVAHGVLVA
jgi:hypothetical protein